MKLWTAVIVLMCCAGAWAQSSTSTASPVDQGHTVKFNINSSITSSALSPDVGRFGCTCEQRLFNELDNSAGTLLAGGVTTTGCVSTDTNFSFAIDPSLQYQWNNGIELWNICTNQPPQRFFSNLVLWPVHATFTRSINQGTTNGGCYLGTYYNVSPWCSNTNSPTVNPPELCDTQTWDVWNIDGACVDISHAWRCNKIWFGSNSTSDLGRATCTVLPAP